MKRRVTPSVSDDATDRALSSLTTAVRASWTQFYNSVREYYVGLVSAGVAQGRLETKDPRAAVDLMLEAIEGVKLRASFEPHIAEAAEQQALVEGLLGILQR